MTDGRLPAQGCLDPETLAAFIDGRLEPRERAAVEAHLAECEDCYEVWMEAVRVDSAIKTPVPVAWVRHTALQWPALLAAAASIVAVSWVGWNLLRRADPVAMATTRLVSAVGANRFAEARLSAPFSYGVAPSPERGVDKPAASTAVRQAALDLQALASDSSSAATLRGAGLGFLATGEVDSAIEALREAAELAPNDGDVQTDLSAALYERWRALRSAAEAARALDAAQRALLLLPDSPPARFNLALAFEAVGLREDALRAWEAYLQVDSTSQWAAEARAHLSRLQRQSAQSLPSLYDRLSRRAAVAWAKSDTAGRRPAATTALQLAAELATAGGDRAWIDLANQLKVVEGRREDCLSQAIIAAEDWWGPYNNGDYSRASALAQVVTSNLLCSQSPTEEGVWREAIIDVAAGRSAQAAAKAEGLERTARPRGYLAITAIAAHIRGIVAMQRGEYDRAVGLYEAALDDAHRAGHDELAGATYAYLITAHSAQGRRALAFEDARQCHMRLDLMPNMRRRYQCFNRGSLLAQETNLPGLDLAVGSSLMRDEVARGFAWTASIAHLVRGRALHALRHDRLALDEFTTARDRVARIEDPAFRLETEVEVAIAEGRTLARSNPARAVVDLTTALNYQQVRANRFRTASLLLDRGRAHALGLNAASAEADWLSGIAIFEDQSLSVRDQQLRIARTADAWDLFDELANIQRGHPAAALATVERGRARELLDSLGRNQTAAYVPDVSFDWIPRDVVVLAYATLPERTLIWRLTRDGIRLAPVDRPRNDLNRIVKAFLRDVGAPGPRDTLSTLLLPREVDLDQATRVIIVPDGELHGVPFGLLRNPATGRLLLETTVLSSAPSVAVLKALLSLPLASGRRTALLVGVGQGRAGLARLDAVEGEAKAAQSYYTPARSKLLLDEAATADAILDNIADYDVFSFSGHAVADPIRPANSHLVIGGSRAQLFPRDVANASLRPGMLVALAACETADGNYFRGEGVMSLARPFLVAGAASVLATLWPVKDQTASRVMNIFHRLVSAGSNPAVALAEAQRAEMTENSGLDWAAFVMIGR